MRLPALLAMALLLACGGDPESPEEQIRALLRQAESAAEAKDVAALKELVADGYRDDRGHDKAEVARLLAYRLLRHGSVHLLVRAETPEVAGPSADAARVRVFAAMAGTPLASAADLSGLRADLYRFDFELSRAGERWQVVGATWDRARPEDFLESP